MGTGRRTRPRRGRSARARSLRTEAALTCAETIQAYALRIGIGERLLPRSDFTLCEQVT
jgi:hypothetical protein